MEKENASKIFILPTRERPSEEARLEKQIKTLSDVLVNISRAGRLIGENDLALSFMCELQSFMSLCYKVGRDSQPTRNRTTIKIEKELSK